MPSLSRAEIFGITIFAVLAAIWLGQITSAQLKTLNKTNSQILASDSIPLESEKISVHIAGAVEKPGVYEVMEGSRINDLLSIAGGTAADAETNILNLAENLVDGEKIYVPFKNEGKSEIQIIEKPAPKKKETIKSKAVRFPININTATKEELMELPNIGEVRANDIIEYRKRHGAFKSREEIINVQGIGDATFEKIKDLIHV